MESGERRDGYEGNKERKAKVSAGGDVRSEVRIVTMSVLSGPGVTYHALP